MNQRGYLKLLMEIVPGYKSYETIDGKSATDALVREKCTVWLNKTKINLEQCRSQLVSNLGGDRSEIKMISSLITVSNESLLEVMGEVSRDEPPPSEKTRERLYELDRNLLELGSQIEHLSEDILSLLIAADDMDLAEREILLQRGITQFRELWRERDAILRQLTY